MKEKQQKQRIEQAHPGEAEEMTTEIKEANKLATTSEMEYSSSLLLY